MITITELKDLNFAERLIIISVRLWVKAFKSNICTISKVRYLFTAAGITGATVTLDAIMRFVTVKAKTKIEINCPSYKGVSLDENRFLGAIAIWEHDHKKEKAEWLIRNWLTHDDNAQVQKLFAVLAYELKDAQILIRPRDWLINGSINPARSTPIAQQSLFRH